MIKTLQKIIFIGSFLVIVFYFLYTLCFSTPWALGLRYGTFFQNAQEVNHQIFDWGLSTLVFSGLGLIFHAHSNRHFYLLNFVFLGLSAYFMIRTGQITLEIVPPLKEVYLALPPLDHRLVLAGNAIKGLYPATTNVADIVNDLSVVFDIGAWLSYALFVSAGLMVGMGLYKAVYRVVRSAYRKRYVPGVKS